MVIWQVCSCRLKSDRARQEELAKERLARMRQSKKSNRKDIDLVTDGDVAHLREIVIEQIEQTYLREREVNWAFLSFLVCSLLIVVRVLTVIQVLTGLIYSSTRHLLIPLKT